VLLLVVIQVLMLLYLLGVKPYASAPLQVLEVICHMAEATIVCCAAALLYQPAHPWLNWIMIGALTSSTECLVPPCAAACWVRRSSL
jgi:hypothetical protein